MPTYKIIMSVEMQDNYVDMQVENLLKESEFFFSKNTNASIWHHMCRMQQNYDIMWLIYVGMGAN